jgi:rRNA maturation RNase YbeY
VHIEYSLEYIDIQIPDKAGLKRVITQIFQDFQYTPVDITYIFCGDEYLLQINKQYLNHDYYTDIITFESSHPDLPADIYISIDRVSENANKYDTDFTRELYRVMFHGVLHLCGVQDAEEKEKLQMRAYEDLYLSKMKQNEN